MKRLISFFCIVTFTLLLVMFQSCSNKIAEIVLNEELNYVVDVYGEEDFFEPVAGVYPVIDKDGKFQVTIDFVKTKKTSNTKSLAEEFVLYPIDKDENNIKLNGKNVEFQAENRNDVVKKLLSANVGDKVSVTFIYVPTDKESKKTLKERIYSCDIDLMLEEDEDTDAEIINVEDVDFEDVENSLEDVSLNSSTNWDKVLDEYESYVDQYIALMKKAQKGDVSALSEYSKMLEKAESFSNKLEDADDLMTPTQVARYTKITNKIANAAN